MNALILAALILSPDPKVTLCHATGSSSNPYVEITVAAAAAFNGHLGDDHQNGEDIIPEFTFRGQVYGPQGDQTILEAGCQKPQESPSPAPSPTPSPSSSPTPSPTPSVTPTPSPFSSPTKSVTPTESPSLIPTQSETPSSTSSAAPRQGQRRQPDLPVTGGDFPWLGIILVLLIFSLVAFVVYRRWDV